MAQFVVLQDSILPALYRFSGSGGNFQFSQPLANGGTDSVGIVLWEVVKARTNVDYPATPQSAREALGERG